MDETSGTKFGVGGGELNGEKGIDDGDDKVVLELVAEVEDTVIGSEDNK